VSTTPPYTGPFPRPPWISTDEARNRISSSNSRSKTSKPPSGTNIRTPHPGLRTPQEPPFQLKLTAMATPIHKLQSNTGSTALSPRDTHQKLPHPRLVHPKTITSNMHSTTAPRTKQVLETLSAQQNAEHEHFQTT